MEMKKRLTLELRNKKPAELIFIDWFDTNYKAPESDPEANGLDVEYDENGDYEELDDKDDLDAKDQEKGGDDEDEDDEDDGDEDEEAGKDKSDEDQFQSSEASSESNPPLHQKWAVLMQGQIFKMTLCTVKCHHQSG